MTNAQKVPGIDDAMEKQICGVANQVTDVFEFAMNQILNDNLFKGMFDEDFKPGMKL